MNATMPGPGLRAVSAAAPSDPATILIAEDDDGHAALIRLHLQEAGVDNPIVRFVDGQELLDFLLRQGSGPHRQSGRSYLLLLDIRMPKVDGVEVLRRMKADREVRKIPVIVLTTTDDPRVVDECYALGCSLFITKPVDAEELFEAIRRIGLLSRIAAAPRIDGFDTQRPEKP